MQCLGKTRRVAGEGERPVDAPRARWVVPRQESVVASLLDQALPFRRNLAQRPVERVELRGHFAGLDRLEESTGHLHGVALRPGDLEVGPAAQVRDESREEGASS